MFISMRCNVDMTTPPWCRENVMVYYYYTFLIKYYIMFIIIVF